MAVEWFIYLGKAAIYAFFTLLAVAWLIWLLVNAKRSLVDSWDSGSFLFTIFVHAMVGLIAGTLAFQSGRTFITHLEKNYPLTPKSTSSPALYAPALSASGPWGEDETTDEVIGSSSRTVYWVPNGKSYHFSRSCPSLSRSDEIERGTLQEARAAGKKDPCNNCAK